MHQCSVLGCRNMGNHSFPRDAKYRKLWEIATRCKNQQAKKHSKVCSAHFKSEDFIKIGKFSGLVNTRRILKKGIVPSVFSWTNTEDNIKSKETPEQAVAQNPKREINFYIELCENLPRSADTAASCSSETAALDRGVDCAKDKSKVIQQNSGKPQEVQHDIIPTVRECGTQKNYQFYTIESFKNDDIGVAFYTGLESYRKFMLVFNTLCPEAYTISHKSSQVFGLSSEDQFFMTLMKLRRNTEDYELGRFFNVIPCSVSNIFITWINFIHKTWSSLNILPSRELLDFYMPEEFKKCYPSTGVVKIEVEALPSGLISHSSDTYAGRTSDRQSGERSELHIKQEKEDTVMEDQEMNVQDMFAHKDAPVNKPSFIEGKCQLPAMTVDEVWKLSSKRIDIEHLVGLTKTYCILNNPVNTDCIPLMPEIFFICVMLCYFRENI